MRRNNGFTLIELIIVVSLIAILSVIGINTFNGILANARDAKRRADINVIAKVLEVTITPGKVYYTSLPANGFSGGVPVDNNNAANKPNYCIRTSTISTAPSAPSATDQWVSTDPCPVMPGSDPGSSVWKSIPSDGLGVGQVGSDPFISATLSWTVCARLESSTDTVLKVSCKSNSQ